MRQILFSFICTFLLFIICNNANSQGIYLSDFLFHDWVANRYPSCVQPDGTIDVTCPAIQQEDTLILRNTDFQDYDGLQYFIGLKYLDLSFPTNNNLSGNIPNLLSLVNLKTLKCRSRPMALPIAPNLEYLDIAYTRDVRDYSPSFPSTLKYLDCTGNQFSGSFNVPPLLDTLKCADNGNYFGPGYYSGIESFDQFPATLKYLDCKGNILTGLPPLPPTLTYLKCDNNILGYSSGPTTLSIGGIGQIPALPGGLVYLNFSGNYVTSIPALPQTLETLECIGNSVTVVPALPNMMRTLKLSANQISILPELPDSLRILEVAQNPSLRCLPHLPPRLESIIMYSTPINCIPNSVNGLNTENKPLCTATNNSNQCISQPVISGTFFYDNNSNGIKDAGENFKAYVQVSSGGQNAFSNNDGYFELSGVQGVNTLTVMNPVNYNSVPASSTYTFSRNDTVVHASYALQPSALIDSIAISVVAVSSARPGREHYYTVIYENIGTTVVNVPVRIRFDNTRMSYINSSAGVTVNGNLLTISPSNSSPGDRHNVNVAFMVNQSAIMGDTIHVMAEAEANSSISTDSTFSVIRASFDPNDKSATPKLSLTQVAAGTYINYTVRFQNTGTDTAINIVLTDVLNSNLDPSTFQLLTASHNCKTTRTDNSLTFEFLDILLPDSNVNEPGSHGYIRFRVKPLATVPSNTLIPNSANIYFDYNSPVLTNTANTLIQLNVVPLKLLSFHAMAGTGDNVFLDWNTSNEINTSSFDIQQGIDGINFSAIGNVAAIGVGDNRYSFKASFNAGTVYYRLKMIDADGQYNYSQIVKVQKRKSNSFVILNNPAKHNLNIVAARLRNNHAVLTNSSGQVVNRVTLIEGFQTIDISSLAPGNYYITAMGETKPIIISR